MLWMTYLYAISFFVTGAFFSAFVCGVILWRLRAHYNQQLKEHDSNREEEKVRQAEERLQHQTAMTEKFEGLAAKALKDNSSEFLELAQRYFTVSEKNIHQQNVHEREMQQKAILGVFEEMRRTLGNVDHKIADLEKSRVGAYQGLLEQVKSLGESQQRLQSETANLSKALRSPNTRGRWGELQLRRVVEMAGMLEHCDFVTQVSNSAEPDQGGAIRPDLVVRLPGGRQIVIDAKTPIEAYLKAAEVNGNEDKVKVYLKEFAASVKKQVHALSLKSYWQQFESSPDFVVMFIPGEAFFSAAVQQDPTLIEFGVERKVLIATPTTLIALLRTAAYGWKQEALAENSKEISRLGAELHSRMQNFLSYVQDLGDTMKKSIKQYNKMVGGLESRVLTTARKFEVMSGITHEKDSLKSVDEIGLDLRALKKLNQNYTPTLKCEEASSENGSLVDPDVSKPVEKNAKKEVVDYDKPTT